MKTIVKLSLFLQKICAQIRIDIYKSIEIFVVNAKINPIRRRRMASKILGQENLAFDRRLNPVNIPQQKCLDDSESTAKVIPSDIAVTKEFVFPNPPRKMVWQKIDVKLVAAWIPTDLDN